MSILTVKLSGEAVWSLDGTWTFLNATTTESKPGTLLTPSPAQTLSFEVIWTTDPVQGDVVEATYLPGDIQKAPLDGEDLMEAFTFTLTNCLDPTSNVGIINSWAGEEGCGTVTLKHNLITLTHSGETLVHTRA